MSISKEKSYLLKDRARELGYDLKLTHCQEMVAKLEGFTNRHSLLVNEKNNISEDDVIRNKIKDFIKENNVVENSDIYKDLLSIDKLNQIKKSIEEVVFNSLCESLTMKFYEFTDDEEQTDCVVAHNYQQALNYMSEMYDGQISRFHSKEVSVDYIKNLKMFQNEEHKGKKVSAYSILEKELSEGEKLPMVLYCNWT